MSKALSHPRATCRSRHSWAPCNGAHLRRRNTIGMSQRYAVRDRPFRMLHGVVGNRRFACASTATDARRDRRTRELDQRKMYLKNCWYAIANACDVKRKIHLTTALDMDLVVYRDHEGLVHCLDGVSPISGEDLSKGALTVVGGSTLIRSRDQDYMYAEDGTILYNGHRVEGQAVDMWDVVEAGGFIWMYFGDAAIPREDRSPIPSIPELADPGWKSVHGEVRIKANHWMVFENVIDMAHVPYVHTATVGQHAQMVDIELELSEHSIVASFPIRSNDGGVSIEAKATAFLPSTSFIRFNFPLGIDLITINSCVPVNEHETVIRFCSLRNCFRTPLLDPLVSRGVKNILGEDKDILEKLLPERINQEISMASDSPQIAFRKMRRRYIDAGLAVAPGWRAPASQQQALRRGDTLLSTSALAQRS